MMRKGLVLSIFSLLIITLTACESPAPEATPFEDNQYATASVATTLPDSTASTPALATSSLPQSFELVSVPGSYLFAEGPAVDANGNIYFSDINAGMIYLWSTDGSVSTFLEALNKPNGLMFDHNGNLIVCEGGAGRLISIDAQGKITVLADKYNGNRFNEPNDLWIDARGGIYFSDPAYQSPVVQDGEHVYYLSPDHSQITRVISDMTRPNGLVGTSDGKTLYVADYGVGQTFAYTINGDGTLSGKRLFATTGSDGMDLDASGNLYLTVPNQVEIFNASGDHLRDIPTSENPTNVAFGGVDGQILFITARTKVYIGNLSARSTATQSQASSFTLTSPDLSADNRLPAEYTCDSAASTLALSWSGAPAGTVGYVVTMHHVAPDNAIHFYWEVYNLPAEVTSLAKNTTGVGSLGTNSVNGRNEYAPPCSKGPGDKEYIYTVYALSAQPKLNVPASQIDRDAVLAAIKDITLASTELHVVYARP